MLGIALSAVALYYYLVVLKQALVARPAPDAKRIVVAREVAVPLLISAGLLVALGFWPSVILQLF